MSNTTTNKLDAAIAKCQALQDSLNAAAAEVGKLAKAELFVALEQAQKFLRDIPVGDWPALMKSREIKAFCDSFSIKIVSRESTSRKVSDDDILKHVDSKIERNIGEIAKRAVVSKLTMSKRLKALEAAGKVKSKSKGPSTFYLKA